MRFLCLFYGVLQAAALEFLTLDTAVGSLVMFTAQGGQQVAGGQGLA